MRFHEPFDDVQYDAAVKRHRMMRDNLKDLRRRYPARSLDETRLLKVYRDTVQEFGRELLKPYDRIDLERLNDLTERVIAAFLDYGSVRGFGQGA